MLKRFSRDLIYQAQKLIPNHKSLITVFVGMVMWLAGANLYGADSLNCRLIGFYDTDDEAYGVYVVDTLAYVADGDDGLRVINVANPAAPVEVGFYDTGGYTYGVYVIDTLAYVADEDSGLRIINVANPDSLIEIGFYDTGGSAWCVYVVNTLAYVADGFDGLYIIEYYGGQGIEERNERLEIRDWRLEIYPNPSFGNALIRYGLPEKADISLKLYDISGRLVKTLYSGTQEKGCHTINVSRFIGIPRGIYFIRLDTDDYKATRKLTIIR